MFFYLSFLRPPPLQAPLSKNILITPQIANDLRTELYEGSQDIYYQWIAVPTPNAPLRGPAQFAMKPIKLTTWKGSSSAYKEIPISPPKNTKSTIHWRLVLSSSPAKQSVDLKSPGKTPFPVTSMPISFGQFHTKDKHSQIERTYRFPVEQDGVAAEVGVTITEQTSFDLDKKVWDSGVGLSSWFCQFALHNSPTVDRHELLTILRSTMLSPEPKKIIELGAGTGLLSLVLAAIRSRNLVGEYQEADSIISTDLDSAMPILSHNITSNVTLLSPKCIPSAQVLDWDDEQLPADIQNTNFDVAVMADVAYNTASFTSLIRTLCSLMDKPQPPIIVLGYKERDAAERTLWELAAKVGIMFTKVNEVEGAGGAPVEIWIGIKQMQNKT